MNETRELIQSWITKADHDLGTAKVVHLHMPEYRDTICFHCQQAIEKYIKAYLIFLETKFQPVHDLVYLLDLLPPECALEEQYYEMAEAVENFAVKVRYPDGIAEPGDVEVDAAITYAQRFRDAIVNKIEFPE
jgi:HEPN domain-containing protein